MPIAYCIDEDQGLIVARLDEPATLAEVRGYVAATLSDPAYSPDLVEVIDARGLAEPDAAAATFDAALLIGRVAVRHRVRARAIIAAGGTVFALARRYERQTAGLGVITRVFRDLASGAAWASLVARRPRAPGPSSA